MLLGDENTLPFPLSAERSQMVVPVAEQNERQVVRTLVRLRK